MKIKSFIYILIAGYLGTFLRLSIDNNLIISILGSFFVGIIVSKRLSYSREKILISGFFSCFTSFSGFIYFLLIKKPTKNDPIIEIKKLLFIVNLKKVAR